MFAKSFPSLYGGRGGEKAEKFMSGRVSEKKNCAKQHEKYTKKNFLQRWRGPGGEG